MYRQICFNLAGFDLPVSTGSMTFPCLFSCLVIPVRFVQKCVCKMDGASRLLILRRPRNRCGRYCGSWRRRSLRLCGSRPPDRVRIDISDSPPLTAAAARRRAHGHRTARLFPIGDLPRGSDRQLCSSDFRLMAHELFQACCRILHHGISLMHT